MKNLKLKLALFLLGALGVSAVQAQYTFLVDSNGYGLPGFYLQASNIVGQLPSLTNLPTGVILTTNANLSILSTNTVNGSAFFLSTNGHFHLWDEYGTQTHSTTNGITVTWTNGNYFMLSNGNVYFTGSLIFGGPASGSGPGLTNLPTTIGPNNVNAGTNCAVLYGFANEIWPGTSPSMNCVILGGSNNWISSGSVYNSAIVAGVYANIYGNYSYVAAGWQNDIFGNYSFTGGGYFNYSTGNYAANIGGFHNYNYGNYSTQLGGTNNTINGNFSVAAGVGAQAAYNGDFVWADQRYDSSTFASTGTNQFLIRALNGVGINTNNPGTNALAVFGNGDFYGLTVQGTNVMSQFNALSILWNYNLTGISNQCAGSNTLAVVNLNSTSNALQVTENANSNAWSTATKNLTNLVTTFTISKAFTATLPATYSSIGIGFSTPLMPDGNYSVSLLPQDANTAGAYVSGLPWYVSSKNNSGFTIYIPYATNAYNLNFDCIVKENTQ